MATPPASSTGRPLKRRWLAYERTGFPPNATRICRLAHREQGGIWPLPRPSAWQVFGPIAVVRNNEGGLDLDLISALETGDFWVLAISCNSLRLLGYSAEKRMFWP